MGEHPPTKDPKKLSTHVDPHLDVSPEAFDVFMTTSLSEIDAITEAGIAARRNEDVDSSKVLPAVDTPSSPDKAVPSSADAGTDDKNKSASTVVLHSADVNTRNGLSKRKRTRRPSQAAAAPQTAAVPGATDTPPASDPAQLSPDVALAMQKNDIEQQIQALQERADVATNSDVATLVAELQALLVGATIDTDALDVLKKRAQVLLSADQKAPAPVTKKRRTSASAPAPAPVAAAPAPVTIPTSTPAPVPAPTSAAPVAATPVTAPSPVVPAVTGAAVVGAAAAATSVADNFPKEWALEPKEEKPKELELEPMEEHSSAPEAAASAPSDSEVTGVEAPEMSQIEKLKLMVNEARLAFVTTDYKQTSWLYKLKKVLGGGLNDSVEDLDTKSTRERYELALNELRDMELAEVKASGLTGAELRERMGKMLNFYKYEERVALAETRDQVKLESANGGQTILSAVESIGREYNKLPRWAKYSLGGVCLAGGLLTGGGVIGGGTAVAVSGLITVKRLIATTGLAVAVDTGIEHYIEGRRKKTSEAEQTENLNELDNLLDKQEEYIARIREMLGNDVELLDSKFRAQKKEALIRRSMVWGTAVAGMVGIGSSWVTAHMGNAEPPVDRDSLDIDRHFGINGQGAAVAASAPEAAVSAPSGAASAVQAAAGASAPDSGISVPHVGGSGTGFEADLSTPTHLGNPPLGTPPDALDLNHADTALHPGSAAESTNVAALRENYPVTAADGERGLWGILEKRLPADFHGDKNRAIQSLENAMRLRLDQISPAERAQAGFHGLMQDGSGKVNLDLIRRGDVIDFQKLLTPQEIQTALEGKSIVLPHTADAVAAAARKAGSVVAETVNVDSDAYKASIEAAQNEMIAADRAANGPYMPDATKVPYEDGIPGKSLVGAPDPYEDAVTSQVGAPSAMPSPVSALHSAVEAGGLPVLNTPEDMAQFYMEHQAEMRHTLVGMGTKLFRTPEVLMAAEAHGGVSPYYYNRGSLGMVKMAWVHEKLGEFNAGTARFRYNSLSLPLHPSQMDNLMRLEAIAQDPRMFGATGLPRYDENVDTYMNRIAAYAVASGKERALAMALNRSL